MKTKLIIAALAAVSLTAGLPAQQTTNSPPNGLTPELTRAWSATPMEHDRLPFTEAKKQAVLNDIGFTNAPATNVISIVFLSTGQVVVNYKH
jgi:hypothetical protein